MPCFDHCDLPLVCDGIAAPIQQNVIVSELDGCGGILRVDIINVKKAILNLAGGRLELTRG